MKLRLVPLDPPPLDPPPPPLPDADAPLDLPTLALAWADELLGARWAPGRHRLELLGESCPFARGPGRHRYRARLRVWEPLCRVDVTLDRTGRPCASRIVTDEPAESPDPGAAEHVAPSVGEAALRAARELALLDEPTAVRAARRASSGAIQVEVERAPRDALVVIDLDPRDGARLGFLVGPFLRGSRRCAALSRTTAIARASETVALPPGARLVRARLVTTPSAAGGLVRCWRLRWDADGRVIVASVNARTGVVVGVAGGTVGAGGPAGGGAPVSERERAAADLAVVVRVQHGLDARAGALVAGATADPRGRPRPLWLAVVTTPRGPLRATIDGGRVTLRPLDAAARLA